MSQMPPAGPEAAGMRPHRGTMILVFGILSIVCCAILGIVAWIMGKSDLEAMASGQMDPSGEGLTKAGKICGMIGVIVQAIIILLYLVLFIMLGIGAAAAAGGAGGP